MGIQILAIFFMIFFCVEGALAASENSSMIDSRDGKKYRTVKIGEQVWMAENLDYAIKGSFCFDDELANCKKYGLLYTWKMAMRACPAGWHLPSKDEFKTLIASVGGKKVAGKILKSKEKWNKNGNGEDSFGFSALPAGCRYYITKSYDFMGDFAFFWSSTGYEDGLFADYMFLSYEGNFADLDNNGAYDGFSVRCIKD